MSEGIKKMILDGLAATSRGLDRVITWAIVWYHQPTWLERRRAARTIVIIEGSAHDRS